MRNTLLQAKYCKNIYLSCNCNTLLQTVTVCYSVTGYLIVIIVKYCIILYLALFHSSHSVNFTNTSSGKV